MLILLPVLVLFSQVFGFSSQDQSTETFKNKIRDYLPNGTETVYPYIRTPQCPAGKHCVGCPVRDVAEIDVVKGDVYVVGIAPVHTTSTNALKCGTVKQGGFDVAQAIKYHVSQAKDFYGVNNIPDADIGVIIIDSCNDENIIAARLLQLLNKGIFDSEKGEFIEVNSKILGYVGGWVSDISIAVASILSRTRAVQISYGSTSPSLSDRERFPYFMRMVPSDIYQGQKMIEIVKSLGSNFIQILYSETAYGIGGKDSLLKHAEENGICVSQEIGFPQTENVDIDGVVGRLAQPNQPTLVLVYLSSFDVVKIMPKLKQMKGFVYVASEGWGNRDVISNGANLEGSITLAHELPIRSEFKEYIETISESEEKETWLVEYQEDYFKCYYQWNFDKSIYPRQCT